MGYADRQDLLAWEARLSSLVSSPGTDSQHPISCQALPDSRMLNGMEPGTHKALGNQPRGTAAPARQQHGARLGWPPSSWNPEDSASEG